MFCSTLGAGVWAPGPPIGGGGPAATDTTVGDTVPSRLMLGLSDVDATPLSGDESNISTTTGEEPGVAPAAAVGVVVVATGMVAVVTSPILLSSAEGIM